jgi:hypothetical protein
MTAFNDYEPLYAASTPVNEKIYTAMETLPGGFDVVTELCHFR